MKAIRKGSHEACCEETPCAPARTGNGSGTLPRVTEDRLSNDRGSIRGALVNSRINGQAPRTTRILSVEAPFNEWRRSLEGVTIVRARSARQSLFNNAFDSFIVESISGELPWAPPARVSHGFPLLSADALLSVPSSVNALGELFQSESIGGEPFAQLHDGTLREEEDAMEFVDECADDASRDARTDETELCDGGSVRRDAYDSGLAGTDSSDSASFGLLDPLAEEVILAVQTKMRALFELFAAALELERQVATKAALPHPHSTRTQRLN